MQDAIDWAKKELGVRSLKILAIPGDASTRQYCRLDLGNKRLVLCVSPPASNDNEQFVDIGRRLLAGGVHAPEIVAYRPESGFFLLEDLGELQLRDKIDESTVDQLFGLAFEPLQRMILDVDAEGLPEFGAALLQDELDFVTDWYLPHHLKTRFAPAEQEIWLELCEQLIGNALSQPQVFAHRDIHACNLIFRDNKAPGVIDFQDAATGPLTYDLISLIWDRYWSWPRPQVEGWIEQFRQLVAQDVDPAVWLRWCDLMGLQRNLKVVGIFARLAYRDGKMHYLDLIPRFSSHALEVLGLYPELEKCRGLLDKYLSGM